MHWFRQVLPAALVALVLAWPMAAPASVRVPGADARIVGVRNADGTYVDGVLVDFAPASETDVSHAAGRETECRIDRGAWSSDSRLWISGEGTHTVTFREAGSRPQQASGSKTVTIVIRSPEPTTTAGVYYGAKGADGSYVGRLDLQLKAALEWPKGEPRPEIVTEYRIDGGPWKSGSSVSVDTPGAHTVSYRSRYYPSWRPVEVVEDARSMTFVIGTPVPVTAAAVHGTSYGDGVYLGPAYVGLTASVDWPGPSAPALTTEYSLDGGTTWTTGVGVEISSQGHTTLLYRSSYVRWSVKGRVTEPPKSLTVEIENPSPVTQASVSGQAGLDGWYVSPVVVTLRASMPHRDPLEGIDYSLDGSSWLHYEAPFAVSAEGTTTVLYRATSAFGGVEADKALTVRIDTLAPTLEPITPGDGVTLVLGSEATARWRAIDTGSGVAREWGSLENGDPLDTSSVGQKCIVYGARDVAGNESWASGDYRVVYEWGGFEEMAGEGGARVFDAGATVPLRFSIRDDSGEPVPDAHARISVLKLSDMVPDSAWLPVFCGAPTVGTTCMYDESSRTYAFNLDTGLMRRGTYRVTVKLDDGRTQESTFALR